MWFVSIFQWEEGIILKESEEIHLFDLENDPFENNNVAQNNPSIVKEMEGILEELTKNV